MRPLVENEAQVGALASGDQRFRQVLQLIEHEMPEEDILCRRHEDRRRGRQARDDGFGQRQAAHRIRKIAGHRVGDPHADVVADNLIGGVPQLAHQTMQDASHGARVIALGGAAGVARAGRIHGDGGIARLCQRLHDVAPREPRLRPTGDQQDGRAVARDGAMDAVAVDKRVLV
ncbi:hypothetical protein D3C71_1583230 [compost metagenome]